MSTPRRIGRFWALAAAGIGFAMTFVYVGLIISEGDEWVRALPFATAMILASVAAVVAEVISDVATGRRFLALSALVFAVIGALGIFTIGLPFLVAAVLAATGFARWDGRGAG